MALTAAGDALTESHRRTQVAISARLAGELLALWPSLDLRALDATAPGYVSAVTELIRRGRELSSKAALLYLEKFRVAEGLSPGLPLLTPPAFPTEQVKTSLLVTGPVEVKIASRSGLSLTAAGEQAFSKTVGAVARHTLNAGRETIIDVVRADPEARGWARVTDGKPCYFCAMLASRGPVYRTKASSSFDAHDRCGCGPEPVYGTSYTWPGRAREFRDLYDSEISGSFGAGPLSGKPGQYRTNSALQKWREVYEASYR